MAYISRHARRRSTTSAESLYLVIVLTAGLLTAWWAGHRIGIDLSAISTVAAVLGLDERTGTTHMVGYSPTQADSRSGLAAYCDAGRAPAFSPALSNLREYVGDAMGNPVECEHPGSVVGDTVQQTSTGLAAYSSITNTETFTDGWHHWALGPNGLEVWDGTSADPPAQNASAPTPG